MIGISYGKLDKLLFELLIDLGCYKTSSIQCVPLDAVGSDLLATPVEDVEGGFIGTG
jgi:hypothetical protein